MTRRALRVATCATGPSLGAVMILASLLFTSAHATPADVERAPAEPNNIHAAGLRPHHPDRFDNIHAAGLRPHHSAGASEGDPYLFRHRYQAHE